MSQDQSSFPFFEFEDIFSQPDPEDAIPCNSSHPVFEQDLSIVRERDQYKKLYEELAQMFSETLADNQKLRISKSLMFHENVFLHEEKQKICHHLDDMNSLILRFSSLLPQAKRNSKQVLDFVMESNFKWFRKSEALLKEINETRASIIKFVEELKDEKK